MTRKIFLVAACSAAVGSFTSPAAAQPTAQLHVVDADSPEVFVERTGATAKEKNLFRILNNGTANFEIADGPGIENRWSFGVINKAFRVNAVGTGVVEVAVNRMGDMTVAGKVTCKGGCVNGSSRKLKTDFALVDEEEVLEKLAKMPLRTWRYKDGADQPMHIGPVAEEFQEAFGFSDGSVISTIDADGVTMAAVKGLNRKLEEKEKELEALRAQNEVFALRLAKIEQEFAKDD